MAQPSPVISLLASHSYPLRPSEVPSSVLLQPCLFRIQHTSFQHTAFSTLNLPTMCLFHYWILSPCLFYLNIHLTKHQEVITITDLLSKC